MFCQSYKKTRNLRLSSRTLPNQVHFQLMLTTKFATQEQLQTSFDTNSNPSGCFGNFPSSYSTLTGYFRVHSYNILLVGIKRSTEATCGGWDSNSIFLGRNGSTNSLLHSSIIVVYKTFLTWFQTFLTWFLDIFKRGFQTFLNDVFRHS